MMARAVMQGHKVVAPFARALSLLSAFGLPDRWLGNRELADRTGLPASTVTRLTQTLVALGYLQHDPAKRKFRLTPAVLSLGFGTLGNSVSPPALRARMQMFAAQNQVNLSLSVRDRLDLIVVESYCGQKLPAPVDLRVRSRLDIGSSPMGWALLAGLPEKERYYLLESVERRMPGDWPRLRRCSSEAVSQVHERGFCTSLGQWNRDLDVLSAPMVVDGQAPFVVSCVGASAQISRARIERELGPRLAAMTGSMHTQDRYS